MPISGYLLNQAVVLRPTPGGLLEPVEIAEAHAAQGTAVCPTSKQNTQVEDDEAGLRTGDKKELICSSEHVGSELAARQYGGSRRIVVFS